MPIPSPYNFVPLSKHVFFPDWAAQVSHDVPFSDGISGWFDIEVEATTPVYIRNGGDLPKRNPDSPQEWLTNPDVLSFFKLPDGRFAIPGTSMKGVIRSVLEIATFGKFNSVDKKRYGVRDLHNPDVYGQYLTDGDRQGGFFPKAKAGWLKKCDGNSWQIIPCNLARVEQEDLEQLSVPKLQLGTKQSAMEKYSKWLSCHNSLCLKATINPEKRYEMHSEPMRYQFANELGVNKSGQVMTHPTLVFTGQPQNRGPQIQLSNGRKKSGGKHMEFVFFEPKLTGGLEVPPQVQEDFLFIHSKPEGGDNKELAYLKKQFWGNKLPMPVFYLAEGAHVTAIGLALMFRLPYRFSPADLAEAQQPDSIQRDAEDLAEVIFGTTENNSPLKGRVNFEPLAAVEDTTKVAPENVLRVLNSPKPSYYPNYLEQNPDPATGKISSKYRTYMDEENAMPTARLRGWKRYVSRADNFEPPPLLPPEDGNNQTNLKVVTSFIPLQTGACFRGRVNFHNLQPRELGAVLWALTWGNDNGLRHRLGMGKPYGFGHVKVGFPPTKTGEPAFNIQQWSDNRRPVLDDDTWKEFRDVCISKFSEEITQWSQKKGLGDWSKTPQVQALKKLATQIFNARDWPHPLNYPPNPKAFSEYKGNSYKPGLALLPVVESSGEGPDVQTLSSNPVKPAAGDPVGSPQISSLPNLIGQQRQVSFQRAAIHRKLGIELWFRLKEGKDKFDAVLRYPSRPDLRGTLSPGQVFKLFVIGIEEGYYLLSETHPESAPA